MDNYYSKYIKYKKKYLQKGGTSDTRIEDDRQNNILSFARVHPRTDIILQIGQKYVFQKFKPITGQLDVSTGNSWRVEEGEFDPVSEFEYPFEELEYLGQKKIRMMIELGSIGNTDKRRPRVEAMVTVNRGEPDIAVIFSELHAFKKNITGQVLMLHDSQVADHICL